MSGGDEKLQKHYAYFDQFLRRAKREFEVKLNQEIKPNTCLDDYEILKPLGAGSFGMVVLAREKRSTNKYCAVKLMEKFNIIKTKQLQHTSAEIRLMKNLNFPFLVDMQGFFMDNTYVGIVMSFANGGDMFIHLREMKKFDEPLAKFYAVQVVLVFEYLHHLGVIYRDLKPENILLDIQGYLKVTDLGFCKKIDNTRTYTLCGKALKGVVTRANKFINLVQSLHHNGMGSSISWALMSDMKEYGRTPEYLAPEIILSQGYNKSVDYWSLGVLIFEMNAGYAPFYARDPMRLYEKIVAGKYSCPPHFSKALKDLLSNMLVVDRTKRYGLMKNGVKDIKGHDWFKNTEFDNILSRKVIPIFVPKVDSETDTRFFESPKKLDIKKLSNDEFAKDFDGMFKSM